ncbi:MAG: RagB/SusD family nutrient uptake outer membrane protein [Bacteroidales bacterium]|nr:RagB/SusD family nutrient uptake outer membrane protein [Bacteroidales bacterium]
MKLKYILSALLLALMAGAVCSCNDDSLSLDKEDVGDLTEDDVFGNPIYAKYFVNNIYFNIPDHGFQVASSWNGAYLDCATDNGEARNLSSSAQSFNSGNWNAQNCPFRGAWSNDYAQIRACNKFLANYDRIPELEGYMTRQDLESLRAQVIFLRAVYYADLLKNFGGVPILEDVLKYNDNTYVPVRSTFKETVEYVTGEFDTAAALLRNIPIESESAYYGRATEGAALAFKAKVLAYAASPLFNRPASYPQYDSADENVAIWRYPDYDKERWQVAADALKAVIDLNKYSLWTTAKGSKTAYETYFVTRYTPNETIMPKLAGPSINIYYNNLPFDFLLVNGMGTPVCYNLPTHDLVEAYEMANGMLIDQEGSGYRKLHPYFGRDPRFESTIWHDESRFCGIEFQTWRRDVTSSKADGKDYITGYSRTGYYLRKYMDVDLNPTTAVTLPNCYPIIRYADILLLYAEALNELNGPEDPGVAEAVNLVRSRASMPDLQTTFANRGWEMTQENVRNLIVNERRIEFAFEEQRFWDVRRWMIGDSTQKEAHEVDIILGDDDVTKSYSSRLIEKRAWTDRMNLMPIPQAEINRCPSLVQNWGWSPASLK